jgi:hypothetical protein
VIAALFVSATGPYANLPGVDPWDITRDARLYAGPWPVIAHPPCERWGRYYWGGPGWKGPRKAKGADDGCFRSALHAVREWGGVLEHPAASAAWSVFGLHEPPRGGGWVSADWQGGWTCCVDQGHYGHRGQKATWLYAVGAQLPSLIWGKAERRVTVDADTIEGRRRQVRTGTVQRMSKRERAETPALFRNVLLGMARTVTPRDAVLQEMQHSPTPTCRADGWHLCTPEAARRSA